MSLLAGPIRAAAFFAKELREVARRPGVLLSVVLGPFLIMLLFGLGTTGFRQPFATEIVIPPDAGLERDAAYYEELADGRIDVVGVTEDPEPAERRLAERKIDLLIVAPDDPVATLQSGERVEVRVAWNEVDPMADAFTQSLVAILVGNINAEIIERAAADGIAVADEELDEPARISPELIARPSTAETVNVAPTAPSVINFFGPAVLALVIQHLGVSLTALSFVRERRGGQMDRYRVAPVSATEMLIGRYLAYGLLSILAGVTVAALLVGVLGVPLIGGWMVPAGVAGLLALTSLGAGFVISLLADSERQAVQLSMLLLLASVFLSGLVLPISDFALWMQPIAYLLPVTHGIVGLQESMLRGEVQSLWAVAAMATMTVGLYVLATILLRRELRGTA